MTSTDAPARSEQPGGRSGSRPSRGPAGGPRTRPRRRSPGWVPNQHGAWAMLVVPYTLGAIGLLRTSASGPREWAVLLLLFATWFLGYFAFHAASLWPKARPRRRPTFVRPLTTYAAITAVTGLATLALAPRLLWWAPVYGVLTGLTMLLVRGGDERSVSSGLLTTGAAGLMAATAQAWTPAEATADHWALAAVCGTYFFGTVLYVKTLIRERGKPVWVWISGAYHLALVAACVVLAAAGGLPGAADWGRGAWVVWAVFFLIVAARAVLVPVLGPLAGRTVTPMQAGIGESVASAVLAAIVLVLWF